MTLRAVFLISTLSQFSNWYFQVCGITQTFKLQEETPPPAPTRAWSWERQSAVSLSLPTLCFHLAHWGFGPLSGRGGEEREQRKKGSRSSYLVKTVVSRHLTGYAWWVFKPDSLLLGTIVRILQWLPSFLIFGDFWTASPLKVVA